MINLIYVAYCMVMALMAVVVFVALFFVKAGYGMFRTKQWGWAIDNKIGWVLMEAPAFMTMLATAVLFNMEKGTADYGCGDNQHFLLPSIFLAGLFLLHYFQRSFVFPFLMTGQSQMPVAIMLMGVVFNSLNAFFLSWGLFLYPLDIRMFVNSDTGLPLLLPFGEWILQPHAIVGILIFFAGMAINMHSDYVIRHLRQPGDTKHYLPTKGMYRYVTSGNYFGELVEWIGFAIASMTPAAWIFVMWTAANLMPRAHAIHRRYREEFGEAVGCRKRMIPWIY